MSLNIDASSSYASLIQRLQSSTKTSTSSSVQGSMPPPPSPQGGESKMMSDLADVFAELGISTDALTTSSSTDTSSETTSTSASSSEAQTALAEFMQTLMDTLHAQGAGKSAAENEGSDGYGQSNPMKADMQTLLSKLGLSSESNSTDSTSSTDSSVSELQSKFSDLLNSLGASDSGISLGDFLTSFSSKIPEGRGQGRIGNVVNTTA
ncbi:hypothetical protein [Pseudaeromonas pectinilytica]